MKPIRFRVTAIENINAQIEYLNEHTPHVVKLLREDISKTLSLIQVFPNAGHDGTVKTTKEIISIKFRYIAVYKTHADWLEVLRFYFR
ncbi:MAG: hypothetical protein JKY46_09015, partial [Robiginitomaculum sp.]|nr:hypothetical protein [Robiginitomaculum sp.]